MADALRLVVGLGNPGTKYEGTRHNIGFMALERMASREGFSFRQQSKLHGLAAEHGIGESRLRLLMPQTYMNDSGRSIRAALDWFGFTPEQLLVLVDDMDIPLGACGCGHRAVLEAITVYGAQFSTWALRPFRACASALVLLLTTPRNGGPAPCPTCSVPSVVRSSLRWMPCWTVCWRPSSAFSARAWTAPVTGLTASVRPQWNDSASRHDSPPQGFAAVLQ